MRFAVALISLSTVCSTAADAAVDVRWDCYLTSGNVGCVELESAFFSNKAYARGAEGVEVDVEVKVRAIGISDGTTYEIELRGKDGFTSSFRDRVPRSFQGDAVLIRLVGDLQKTTAPLFVVDEPAALDDGSLALTLLDPSAGPRAARKDDETTGWYVAPGVSLNAERFGITSVHGNGFVEVNWSHPDWRIRGFGWGNYRLVQAEDPGGQTPPEDLHYENFEIGTFAGVSRAWDGFSIAAAANVERKPQNNTTLKAASYLGAEWVLVPFLKTDEGNVGVQYVIGAEHYEYVLQNVRLRNRDDVLVHALKLFGAWHFARVDVSGNLNAGSLVVDPSFASIGTGGSVTWRILDDLSLSLTGDASYRTGVITEPKDLSQLHPLEQFYGGGGYGDVTLFANVSLQYTFGNSLMNRQDQRWR